MGSAIVPVNIALDRYIESKRPKTFERYSPFSKSGRGNQGYLYEIGRELGDYLMELILEKNENIKKVLVVN